MLQKLVPLAATPLAIPVVGISILLVAAMVFVYVLWMPRLRATTNPHVVSAYNVMVTALADFHQGRDNGLMGSHEPYARIEQYVRAHPNDILGAYQVVVENGGQGRNFTDDTQALESAVSAFHHQFEVAESAPSRR